MMRPADAGRKAIPDHFPRIEIEHDLEPEQKLCTKCAVPHPLTRIGQGIRECYRFEPPKISVEKDVRPTYVWRSGTRPRSRRRPSFAEVDGELVVACTRDQREV